ncbi:MAG: hypothetical protein AAB577_00805 [Patescibacteria group bacterium]
MKNKTTELSAETKELSEICKCFQLWFQFLGKLHLVAETEKELKENIALLRFIKTDISFSYKSRKAPWSQQMAFLAGKGDISLSREVSFEEVKDLLEPLNVSCECGNPATVILNCSCGNYVWCQDCVDSCIFWNHADHDCSPECCAQEHKAPAITLTELETMVDPLNIEMKKSHSLKYRDVFVVFVHLKTASELFEEMRWVASNRYSAVLDQNGKEIDFFNDFRVRDNYPQLRMFV